MYPSHLRVLLLALASSLALLVPAGVAGTQEPGEPGPVETEPEAPESDPAPARPATDWKKVRSLRKAIRTFRGRTWHWQRVMGTTRTGTRYGERRTASVTRLTGMRNLWRTRAQRTVRRAERVPNRSAWLCIHRHEGPWNDPHAPYYGGLQMDMTFQQMYGRYLLSRKGTANRWRPLEQMWTAEKARRSGRGFHPWPNTARRCGLI